MKYYNDYLNEFIMSYLKIMHVIHNELIIPNNYDAINGPVISK